jgi:geranylgeranyl diphosphate synthase, type I
LVVPDEYLLAIEQELRSVVEASTSPGGSVYADFFKMLRYHLGWTDARGAPVAADLGKRLRPLLCLLSCEAAGGVWRAALPAATAIELVHNFSLIHDDIQDNSHERRGRPTVWSVWGMAQGINAGDAMFALARLALDRLQDRVLPSTYIAVHRMFDEATLALTRGQFLDISFESRSDVTVEAYLTMVRGKTAALLSAPSAIGARVATDDAQRVDAFARYGENMGIAYQIVDDILGIWGDPAVTGKSAASDILAKKKSLPILIGWESDASGALAKLFARPQLNGQDVAQVLNILDRAGARRLAQAQADQFLKRAFDALDATGLENPAIARLRELARSATRREK